MIRYWFEVTAVPRGGAPAEVRERWMGVPLPVRRPRPIEGPLVSVGRDVAQQQHRNLIPDSVVVEFDDAVEVLRLFGRDDAAQWWTEWVRSHGHPGALVFRANEGRLLPSGYVARRFPELDAFGLPPV